MCSVVSVVLALVGGGRTRFKLAGREGKGRKGKGRKGKEGEKLYAWGE